jgi:hypothetical protein
VTDDASDRLIDALREHSPEELEALHRSAVDRAVTRFQRQKAGLEPWGALDALRAAQDAWERRRRVKAPKAA